MERLIPITEKQLQLVKLKAEAMQQAQAELKATCDAIMAGLADEPAESALLGVRKQPDGQCVMVLDIPEPPQAAE